MHVFDMYNLLNENSNQVNLMKTVCETLGYAPLYRRMRTHKCICFTVLISRVYSWGVVYFVTSLLPFQVHSTSISALSQCFTVSKLGPHFFKYLNSLFFFKQRYGGCANAIPPYQKLRTRVSHVWGDRKLQPDEVQCTVSTRRDRLVDHGTRCAR